MRPSSLAAAALLAVACDRSPPEPAPSASATPSVSAPAVPLVLAPSGAPSAAPAASGPPVAPATDVPKDIALEEARLLTLLSPAARAKVPPTGPTLLMRLSMSASVPHEEPTTPASVAWTEDIAVQVARGIGPEPGNVFLALVAGLRAVNAALAPGAPPPPHPPRVKATRSRIQAALARHMKKRDAGG